MAVVTSRWFTKGGKNLIEQEIGWVTGPIFVALMQAGYVFDRNGPEVYADVSAAEAVGSGYVAGGLEITGRSVVVDTPSNETRLLGAATQWLAPVIISRGAVIYANVGAKPLLGFTDFGIDRVPDGGNFLIEWDPDRGVLFLKAR